MSTGEPLHRFAGGEVYFWVEQGASIHLKASSPHGDPTELTADDAREIAAALSAAAAGLDSLENTRTSPP